MNELVTDLKALHEETLNNLKSSKASNTIRAYKSDFKDFGAFCAKHGFKSLPTEPKIVALYLTYLSGKDSKMSTLRRRLVSISMIHKHKRHYLDTKHPIIIESFDQKYITKNIINGIPKPKRIYFGIDVFNLFA